MTDINNGYDVFAFTSCLIVSAIVLPLFVIFLYTYIKSKSITHMLHLGYMNTGACIVLIITIKIIPLLTGVTLNENYDIVMYVCITLTVANWMQTGFFLLERNQK